MLGPGQRSRSGETRSFIGTTTTGSSLVVVHCKLYWVLATISFGQRSLSGIVREHPEARRGPGGPALSSAATYQFEGAVHPMTGLAPDQRRGPHKLIVVAGEARWRLMTTRFAVPEPGPWRRRSPRRGTGWLSWSGPALRMTTRTLTRRLWPSSLLRLRALTGSRDLRCARTGSARAAGVIAGITKLCARDDFDCSSGFALARLARTGVRRLAVQTSKASNRSTWPA